MRAYILAAGVGDIKSKKTVVFKTKERQGNMMSYTDHFRRTETAQYAVCMCSLG